jgi:signal transduction histidine kinase
VPMIHNGQSIGVIAASRKEPGAFADPEVAVLQTFADQAVIAIENVNLFNQLKAKTGDLEELLYQQTATAEVLKVISESVFELQPVFDTMAENAVRLCKAERALIFRFDGNLLRAVASHNVGPELWQFIDRNPIAPGRQSISARAALYRRTVQVADVQSDADYSYAPRDVDLIRTIVAVPMLKGDQLVGTITIYKLEAKPFTDKQITLIETFAEQAVIAIENARLFEEVQARTRDLSQSLDDLRTAQDRLVQAEKLASLGQLTAGIAHEIKNPLNFVNNFADLSGELLQELKEAAAPALTALDDEKRAEVDEIMGMLDRNLGKIAEHGRRADGIVKSMLAHSRGGSSERRAVDLNNLVEEALNLAYHGARAQDQSFNITLERAFDPDLAPIELVPQDVTRVLLNLIGNGFYAANERSQEASNRPVLKVSTRDLGTAVEIRVRDNGIGIAPIYRDKLFQPFFTTKPTGEGTGLGLSISYDIVTQQHGGTIEVDSEPGAFTEFTVRLPRGRQIATGGARER